MALNFDKQNERVINWATLADQRLKGAGNALGIRHRSNSPSPGASLEKIGHRIRYKSDVVNIISFRFSRSLIWPHKGAGKGIGGAQGSRWTDKYGVARQTNPNSLGKIGDGRREEKPWFNEFMESADGVEQLATIVAEETGDALVNNLLIR